MTHTPDEILSVTLARIETKLDHSISLGSDHEGRIRSLEAQQQQAADHEPRLRTLESRQWPLPSLAALLSVAAVIMPFIVR